MAAPARAPTMPAPTASPVRWMRDWPTVDAHDGGADGSAEPMEEGPADGGARPGGHDGGADGSV